MVRKYTPQFCKKFKYGEDANKFYKKQKKAGIECNAPVLVRHDWENPWRVYYRENVNV